MKDISIRHSGANDIEQIRQLCRGDEVLGQLGLCVEPAPRRRHVANIGMGVRSHARRLGVGSALMSAAIGFAEQWLGIRRIELTVYTDNDPAIALYQKFGFGIEGTARQYAFRNGVFVDVHAMSRLVT
jgi:putative acetyltransferase